MKKVIIINDTTIRKVCLIISKKRFAICTLNKISKNRFLQFFKGSSYRYLKTFSIKGMKPDRHCNIGPQFSSKSLVEYSENDRYHNLYGPSRIYIINGQKKYDHHIKDIYYHNNEFNKYILIYNNLTYKRTY